MIPYQIDKATGRRAPGWARGRWRALALSRLVLWGFGVAGHREAGQQVTDLARDPLDGGLVVLGRRDDRLVHPRRDLRHVLLAQAAGGDGRGAEPDAGRVERLARVERHRVVVQF